MAAAGTEVVNNDDALKLRLCWIFVAARLVILVELNNGLDFRLFFSDIDDSDAGELSLGMESASLSVPRRPSELPYIGWESVLSQTWFLQDGQSGSRPHEQRTDISAYP
jgi:hypothetical protein